MKYMLVALLLMHQLANAQTTKSDSLWSPLKPLIGKWVGTGQGPEGTGSYERTYRFVLNNKFIELRNKTTYPPTKGRPQGYIHEDYGYISYDKLRKTFVLRQFHGEGFVNQYVLQQLTDEGRTLVFVTESIENIPTGWRARESYSVNGNVLIENFELAEPNKEFEPYTKASFKKVK